MDHETLDLQDNLTYREYPVRILDQAERVTRRQNIKFLKVQWSHHSEREATWEREIVFDWSTPLSFRRPLNLGTRFSQVGASCHIPSSDMTYEIGDKAYLRVTPMRGTHRFGIKGKLAPRYIGPFRILAKRGEVAY